MPTQTTPTRIQKVGLRWSIVAGMIGLALAVGGCGSSAPTTPRNEADWAEARAKARAEVAGDEGLIGPQKARENERALAMDYYNALVDEERATPAEKEALAKGEEPTAAPSRPCGEHETTPMDGCKE
jgi:hypothetical protein